MLGSAAEGTIQEYDNAIAAQPLQVGSTAWQTRWPQLAQVW